MSLIFVLLSCRIGMLFSAMKRSASYKAFFSAMPCLAVLEQLKSAYFDL